MTIPRAAALAVLGSAIAVARCGGPTAPSSGPLPFASESAHYVYHYAAGDAVDAVWQETCYQWATARLGVRLPQKIAYFKYQNRVDMGNHTGHYDTNGYADTGRLEIHTLWACDNHEVVHLLMSRLGQSSALFSEGVAVAFQTDPAIAVFESRFNGEEVHHAARRYLQGGELILPLDRIIETSGFRAVSDTTLSYREAGSFVRFLIDEYGLDRFLAFYRSGVVPDDSNGAIKRYFQSAMGVAFDDAEAAWLTMLRAG